jgi:beta-galactosidase
MNLEYWIKKNHIELFLFKLFLFILSYSGFSQNHSIILSGQWQVKLDPKNEWIKKSPDKSKTEGVIVLPSSLAEAGYGYKTEGPDFGVLTPEYRYIGKAWYTREIEIPASWENLEIVLFLERVLWESVVFVNGKELSRQDALGTPHAHKLGTMSPGTHKLTICVDNEMIHNIGDKGHGYGEYTQSSWNGIVGRIELTALPFVHIESVRTFPDISEDILKMEWKVNSPRHSQVEIDYSIVSVSTGETVINDSFTGTVSTSGSIISHQISVQDRLEKWSDFNSEVYLLKSTLNSDSNSVDYETEFGYYQVSHDGTKILINGEPVFLRGNLDCVHFPLTGYPSCDLEDWMEIFRTYKAYGLNHARFHSWCPPEAAFKAANRLGIYLQAEASIWIDWWMSTDMVARGRPEMDTKGHPAGVGKDPERDRFIVAEMNRVVDFYGNNPSFTMFCIGNELGNGDFNVMKNWIADLKTKDPRRLYAASTAREITETDDYSATHNIPGVGRTRGLNGPRTNWDFEKTYAQSNVPIIAHEIGQWPVYPRWSEIEKYKGVLKARNLKKLKKLAEENGVAWQDEDFARASGALNQIMYKYEAESFLRTPSCAGVQLLSMQDYQGQGEALIGWLDCHWESKGITTPEKFRQHFTTTVPLLRIEKFVWENSEMFQAKAQLAHHGEKSLSTACTWKIEDEKNNLVASGSFDKVIYPVGSLSDLGEIQLDLNQISAAHKLTISIGVAGTNFQNSWDIWVYPDNVEEEVHDIFVTDELNAKTFEKLKNGQKVLLDAHQLGTDEQSVSAHFYPLYWSLTFFPGQGKTNIGLLLDEEHPAFDLFPTSFHSDWQWETICSDAKGFILNELPDNYLPIAQPIDDFHRSNKVGSIFELKVGKGKLLVCGYNLNSDLPVARQLKKSLLKYMSSKEFQPEQEVKKEWLQKLMPVIPSAETVNIPEEFNNAILYFDAANNLQKINHSVPWKKEFDEIKVSKGTNYKVKADGAWKDEMGSAWHGKEMELIINCPEGILGTLLVHFDDWNKNGRTGLLEFEGRKLKLGNHEKGQWVKFHVMREDSNDGKLVLKTYANSGPNLIIREVILLSE